MSHLPFFETLVSGYSGLLDFIYSSVLLFTERERESEREMEIDLSPKLAKKVYGGDGGAYYAWSPDELPMLRQGNIGAAKLSLDNNGFALPRYSDSAKVAYVLQGKGVAGIVLPEKEEKVIAIKKGDAIALPFGVVTWWYNKEDTELVILFLGDTSKAHKSGSFTDFFLTGSNGIFTGFSTEFVSRAWDLKEDVVKTLVAKQTGNGVVKLEAGFKMPEPNNQHRDGMALNCEEAPLDVDIKKGGRVVVLNTKNLPLVGEVGLGADLVRLDGSAMCSPGFSCDSALQVTYIVRGSGRVQVVGIDGKRVLETTLKGGNLFIVPRFFVVSKIADPEGMEWFSIITTPDPIFTHLAGSIAPWKALSPEVVRASFNVDSDVEQQFRSKRAKEAIFFPPPN
ncbi:legumin A-like [Camellia sinensis]|uniref:legumin A-like n=1 Tax=Camellia sinensis TaxID=4442 RepID=UPI001036A061|nr:legumin A-like [Camellia sinensis]